MLVIKNVLEWIKPKYQTNETLFRCWKQVVKGQGVCVCVFFFKDKHPLKQNQINTQCGYKIKQTWPMSFFFFYQTKSNFILFIYLQNNLVQNNYSIWTVPKIHTTIHKKKKEPQSNVEKSPHFKGHLSYKAT
jgi:hypothetical protein